MKKILFGTALAVFALGPAMSFADCDFHNKASMASAKPAGKAELAQAQAASKSPARVVAKATTARQVKQGSATPAAPSTAEASTVVAKSN